MSYLLWVIYAYESYDIGQEAIGLIYILVVEICGLVISFQSPAKSGINDKIICGRICAVDPVGLSIPFLVHNLLTKSPVLYERMFLWTKVTM